jgi:hypothetical protein
MQARDDGMERVFQDVRDGGEREGNQQQPQLPACRGMVYNGREIETVWGERRERRRRRRRELEKKGGAPVPRHARWRRA